MADAKTLEEQRIKNGVTINRTPKLPVFMRLPPYIKEFISNKDQSQALIVEKAIVNAYDIKVPEDRKNIVFEEKKVTGKKYKK